MSADFRDHLQGSLGSAYVIERELAAGGMSRVFLAVETALQRQVVVKVLPPDLAASVSIARFNREIMLAARLQHAHIVPLLSAGVVDDLPYFTMPFVAGESLRTRLLRHGELPVQEAVRLLREVASALAYAHAHGVVHRDIKPDNILLSGGASLVTDFGVAKAISMASPDRSESVTSVGVAIGTPAYMSPEQVSGDPTVDQRADLYAFGVLAYELLTGEPPFSGRTPGEVLSAHLTQAPVPVSERRPSLPPTLGALVDACLQKRPADRPQSAEQILHVLDALSTPGQTVTSAPGPALAAGARNTSVRRVAIGVVVGVVAIIAAFALRTWRTEPSPTLAVLTLRNLGDSTDADLATGIAVEISSALVRVPGLQVIASSSTDELNADRRSIREIARRLDATHVLDGTLQGAPTTQGRMLHVIVRLVRARDETSVWSDTFDEPLSDVLSLQSRVAERVASALNVELTPRPAGQAMVRRTDNPAAYLAYARGLRYSTRPRLNEPESRMAAIAAFEEAVSIDTAFAEAHARLVAAYLRADQQAGAGTYLPRALGHLARAMQLDSALTETRLVRAWLLWRSGKPADAMTLARLALGDAPSNVDALSLIGQLEQSSGRLREAEASYQRAKRLDPLSPDPPAYLASLYDDFGRYDDAVRERESEMALTPDNAASYFAQAQSYLLWRYDTSAARQVLERGIAAAGRAAMTRSTRAYAIYDVRRVVPRALLEGADTLTRQAFDSGGTPARYHEFKAMHFALTGRLDRARPHFDSLVTHLAGRTGGDAAHHALLARALAYLDRATDATREGDLAIQRARADPDRRVLARTLASVAFTDVVAHRPEAARARLAEAFELRSGFFVSPTLVAADRMWSPGSTGAGAPADSTAAAISRTPD